MGLGALTPAAHGLLPAAAPVVPDEEPAPAPAACAHLTATAGHPHHLFRTGLHGAIWHPQLLSRDALGGCNLPVPLLPHHYILWKNDGE